ncbi:hypothetical protein MRB53_030252 [Persea americana]|uniref:Uncharacterized protein n=1 Tax=Persea americana TaxID=3435 RepID=A0ACC2KL05_PERAE|nr:hypothetical protein MRB53_030252 [Persea americana]
MVSKPRVSRIGLYCVGIDGTDQEIDPDFCAWFIVAEKERLFPISVGPHDQLQRRSENRAETIEFSFRIADPVASGSSGPFAIWSEPEKTESLPPPKLDWRNVAKPPRSRSRRLAIFAGED